MDSQANARRRRTAVALAQVVMAVVAIFITFPSAANAVTYNCVNGDHLTPPYNLTDRCAVSTIDRNTQFVGVMTGGDDVCDPNRTSSHTQRVRVIADYVRAGNKLLMRSIGIRYVQGVKPWAYYSVQIEDGNGQFFRRPFNNNGDPIGGDGASDVVDNVTTVTPTPGFAPTFGASGRIYIQVKPYFFSGPHYIAGHPECVGEGVALQFVAPV